MRKIQNDGSTNARKKPGERGAASVTEVDTGEEGELTVDMGECFLERGTRTLPPTDDNCGSKLDGKE
jgi:hypothetical protein